jgi:hypothetical protein
MMAHANQPLLENQEYFIDFVDFFYVITMKMIPISFKWLSFQYTFCTSTIAGIGIE